MFKYKSLQLEEVCEIKGGKRLPKGSTLIVQSNNHPYIRIKDLDANKTLEINDNYEYVDEVTHKIISNYIVKTGDIILSIVGTIGLVNIVGKSLDKANLTENCVKLTNFKNVNSEFVYYYLMSKFARRQIEERVVGAVQPKLPIKNIKSIKINCPDLKIQNKIVQIMSYLDEKIELNNEINNNLEKQARAIFLNIFLEYLDPTNHSIPLKDCTSSIIKGKTTKYVKYSSLLNLNQKVNKGSYLDEIYYKYLDPTIEIPTEKYIQYGDLLLNSLGQGTLGRIHLWNRHENNIVADQHITIIRAKANVSTSLFLYHLLTSKYYKEYIQNCVMGSTGMQMLNISTIRELPINLPTYVIQTKFTQLITPLYIKMEINRKENIYLNKIKKLIIPKLLSGELDVTKLK